jgi:hypothetical protein
VMLPYQLHVASNGNGAEINIPNGTFHPHGLLHSK